MLVPGRYIYIQQESEMVNFCALKQAHVHGKKVVQRFAQNKNKLDKNKLESHFLQTLKISCWLQKNIQEKTTQKKQQHQQQKKTLPFLYKTHRQTHKENLSKKKHALISFLLQTNTNFSSASSFFYIFLKAPPIYPTTPPSKPNETSPSNTSSAAARHLGHLRLELRDFDELPQLVLQDLRRFVRLAPGQGQSWPPLGEGGAVGWVVWVVSLVGRWLPGGGGLVVGLGGWMVWVGAAGFFFFV